MDTRIQPIPFANPVFIYGRKNGLEISVNATYKGTIAQALQFEETLNSALFDSNHKPRLVDFSRWYDSDSIVKGIYRSLYCTSGPVFETSRHNTRRPFGFTLQGLDPGVYTTGSTGTTPGTSPYDNLSPSSPGGTPAVPLAQIFTIMVDFPGVAEVTGAGNVNRFQKRVTIPGADGSTMHIIGMRLVGVSGLTGASGNTVFKVSDAAYDGAGNVITHTVAFDAPQAALTEGDLEIAANADAYVFLTSANGHVDAQLELIVSS